MVPSPEPPEPLQGRDVSDEPSEPVASEREMTGKRRSNRSELYKRMKRVDPGLARKYRQLEGQ